jgi:hypothetical protein
MLIGIGLICFLILWIYISFNWYAWKTNIELWQLRINKNKEKINRTAYKTFDEMMVDLNKKDVWYKDLYLTIRVKIEQFFDIPRDVYRFFKRGLQRWARGWADEDCWSIDGFLTSIIPPMLKRLKETKHGLPTWAEDKTEEQAQKEWDDILDSIIYTFEVSKNISDSNLFYQPSEEWSRKEANKYNKIWVDGKYEPKPRAMTLEECKRYELGWSNLKRYFFSLWD